MDDDLAAEIARIEAELAQDTAVRQQQQQQAQQQTSQLPPQVTPSQQQQQQPQAQQQQQPQPMPAASVFGFPAAPVATQQALPQAAPHTMQNVMQQQQQQQPPMTATTAAMLHAAQQQQQQLQPQQQQSFHPQPVLSTEAANYTATTAPGVAGAGSATNAAGPMLHHFDKDADDRSIFVSNLPRGENGGPTTTVDELRHFFSVCGPVQNCTLLRDRVTQELKGTAYVEFATYAGMGVALDKMNNADYKGSTINVTRKRSYFRPDRARGGRGGSGAGVGRGGGRGGGAAAAGVAGPDPYQAIATLMGMMMGGAAAYNPYHAYARGGGRGGGVRGGRGGGRGGGGGTQQQQHQQQQQPPQGGAAAGASQAPPNYQSY